MSKGLLMAGLMMAGYWTIILGIVFFVDPEKPNGVASRLRKMSIVWFTLLPFFVLAFACARKYLLGGE